MLDVFGHRRFRKGSDFAGVGPHAREGDGEIERISVGGTDLRLRNRELQAMFAQVFEQSRNGVDVSGGIRIEHDNIIEVGGHVGKAFYDFVDHLDESSWRRVAPLWHDQRLEEARGRAECREGDRVFMNRYLVERSD